MAAKKPTKPATSGDFDFDSLVTYPHIWESATPKSQIVMKASDNAVDSAAFQGLLDGLTAAIAPLQALHQQAVENLAPTVREIRQNHSRDTRLIEHTLDHLLDHACIPKGLACFKSLCRYYWQINPHATASYIFAYREMWDSGAANEPST